MNQFAEKSAVPELSVWLSTVALEGISVTDLFAGFCERMVSAGIPLTRSQIGTGVVHHGARGYGMTWRSGTGIHDAETFQHKATPDPRWYRSPGVYMLQNNVPFITARLDVEARPDPWFSLYDDLLEEGITEYHTEGFSFGWKSTADHDTHVPDLGIITSWSTDRAGGFGADLVALRQVIRMFALAVKTMVFIDMADDLMTTYVGKDTGQRILHGDVHRGDTRVMPAAILLADLRGFTAMSDRIPTDDMVALLNLYLERLCEQVYAEGGEVLKFLGDGLLAIFAQDGARKAEAALAAAKQAREAILDLNRSLTAEGKPCMPLDIALHLGDVSYGNIGAPERLDFTVIGPAVNEAARIEAACGMLGHDLLLSEALVDALGSGTQGVLDLGEHELRGVSGPRRLYGVPAR